MLIDTGREDEAEDQFRFDVGSKVALPERSMMLLRACQNGA
jgi:hypothetical protein